MSRVAVICGYSLPTGMAATVRIMAYSKGMVQNGCNVIVYSFNPTSLESTGRCDNSGEFEGVLYRYFYRKKRVKNKILHIIELLWSFILSIFHLYLESKKEKFDSIILSDDNPVILWFYTRLSRLLNTKCFFIFDEYPYPIRVKLRSEIGCLKAVLYKLVLSDVTGYIGMTENLINYYNDLQLKPSIVLTSITDVERFPPKINLARGFEERFVNIVYMGNMELSKDNVDNIIRAFSVFAERFPESILSLYGRPSARDKALLNKLVLDKGLGQCVFFDSVEFSQVPKILRDAQILVSSQPRTKRAEGGFPTKLGEYLCSGTPTLVTDVGEISRYVEDGKNVFLVEPEDHVKFASKLIWIIENYRFAKDVGIRGRKLVLDEYSSNAAGKKMLTFINDTQ